MQIRNSIIDLQSLSPMREFAAYEALWDSEGASVRSIAKQFEINKFQQPPSSLLSHERVQEYVLKLSTFLSDKYPFEVCFTGEIDFPDKLLDATNPVPFLYFKGAWDLIYSQSISIVGARDASEEGIRRTQKLVKSLVEEGYIIVSGLAKGIDTVAHSAAIHAGGKTIAVIGTPINEYYPKENKTLQDLIAKEHLLISQVPFLKYHKQDYKLNRFFFPERNKLMAAISSATIIVEASDTSGTLIQAKEALKQRRQVFILDSCFQRKEITWPEKYLSKGAVRVKDDESIKQALSESTQARKNRCIDL